MNKIVRRLIISVIVIFIAAIAMFTAITVNMNKVKAITVTEAELQLIDDGEYTGEYYYKNQIGASVFVQVRDNEIVEILITDHITGLGKKAEAITQDIISNQSLLVDDVSGATVSSHVIKLAIKNALEVKE